jgi:hypothetical protein
MACKRDGNFREASCWTEDFDTGAGRVKRTTSKFGSDQKSRFVAGHEFEVSPQPSQCERLPT